MDLRCRSHDGTSSSSAAAASTADPQSPAAKASDALPLPLHLTNAVFFTLFFSLAYYLLHRWRDKIRSSSPLHLLTFSDIAAIFALIASFIYLLGFFGIDFVQSFIARPPDDLPAAPYPPCEFPKLPLPECLISAQEDELIVDFVVAGAVPSHALEARLGDCRRATARLCSTPRDGPCRASRWRGSTTSPSSDNAARCYIIDRTLFENGYSAQK